VGINKIYIFTWKGRIYTGEYYNTNGVVVVVRPSSLENIFPPKHFVKVVDPLTFARILPLPPSKKHTDSRSQRNTPHAIYSLSLCLTVALLLSSFIYICLSLSHCAASEAAILVYRCLRVRVPQQMKGIVHYYARGRRETELMMKYTSRGDCTTVTNRSRGGGCGARIYDRRVCVYAADYLITGTSAV
jgi:hypothetical protein